MFPKQSATTRDWAHCILQVTRRLLLSRSNRDMNLYCHNQGVHDRMPKSRPRRSWRKLRRLVWGLVALSIAVLIARNWIAKTILEQVGTSTLGTQVSIGQVNIGLHVIRIRNIRITDAAFPDFEQVTIDRVDITPKIWQGIQNGTWCENVFVLEPSLHVRFDQAGNLVSKFPSTNSDNSSDVTIPLRSLVVSNSKLFVHQAGRQPISFQVDLLDVEFGDKIEINAVMRELLGGQVKLRSSLDAKSFQGSTRLEATGIQLDSGRMSSWPLVPSAFSLESATATVSLSAAFTHPPNDLDLRNHAVVAAVNLQSLDSASVGRICEQVEFWFTNHNGIVEALRDGDILTGRFEWLLSSDLNDQPMTVNVRGKAEQLAIHQLKHTAERLSQQTLPTANLFVSANLKSTIVHNFESTQFEVGLETRASGLSFDNVSVNDATTQIQARGAWLPRSSNPLQGDVSGSFDWGGIPIVELAKRFGLGNATGMISSSGQFKAPLGSIRDPNTYRLDGQVRATNVATCGLSLEDSACIFSLRDGRAILELSETRLVDSTEDRIAQVAVSVRAGLAPDSQLVASCSATNLTAKAIARLLKLDDSEFDGEFSSSGLASVPINKFADPRAWSIDAKLGCQRIVIVNETIGDFTGVCQLRDGQLTIPETAVHWRESSCRFALHGTIVESPRLIGSFHVAPILLADVSSLVSRNLDAEVPAKGQAEIGGQVVIEGFPLNFQAAGKANLLGAEFGGTRIGSASLNWQADQNELRVTSTSDDFLGGNYAVTATIQNLDLKTTNISGTFAAIQTPRLLQIVGAKQVLTTGALEGGFEFNSITSLHDVVANAWVKSRGVTVEKIPVEIALADLQLEKGLATMTLKGRLCDGNIDAVATGYLAEIQNFVQDENPRFHKFPVIAEATLVRLPVERLVRFGGLKESLAPLTASISGHLLRDAETIRDGLWCQCTGTTENISWNRSRLSDRITADVVVSPSRIALRELRGRIADGQLSGRAEIDIQRHPQGTFKFSASNMSLRRASAPFLKDRVSGNGSVAVSGRIGSTITGQLIVRADNASVAELAVQQVRIPIDWSYASGLKDRELEEPIGKR